MINKISPTGQKEEEKEEKGGYLRKKACGLEWAVWQIAAKSSH